MSLMSMLTDRCTIKRQVPEHLVHVLLELIEAIHSAMSCVAKTLK